MSKAKKPIKRVPETIELQTTINALKGASHNPVDWVAIVTFVAPIIIRWATRVALNYYSRKSGKRISSARRTEVSQYVSSLSSTLTAKLK